MSKIKLKGGGIFSSTSIQDELFHAFGANYAPESVTAIMRIPVVLAGRFSDNPIVRMRKDIFLIHDDWWNGSYHAPEHGRAEFAYLVAKGRRAGRLGRLRSAYREIKEFVSGRETGKTIAIRKGVWREEGD